MSIKNLYEGGVKFVKKTSSNIVKGALIGGAAGSLIGAPIGCVSAGVIRPALISGAFGGLVAGCLASGNQQSSHDDAFATVIAAITGGSSFLLVSLVSCAVNQFSTLAIGTVIGAACGGTIGLTYSLKNHCNIAAESPNNTPESETQVLAALPAGQNTRSVPVVVAIPVVMAEHAPEEGVPTQEQAAQEGVPPELTQQA